MIGYYSTYFLILTKIYVQRIVRRSRAPRVRRLYTKCAVPRSPRFNPATVTNGEWVIGYVLSDPIGHQRGFFYVTSFHRCD